MISVKKISCSLILLTLTTGCTASSTGSTRDVSSWETLETKAFNNKIHLAYKTDLNWADKPELYVFNLFEMSDLKRIFYEYNSDRIENPERITLTITRDGFLDDSVRGDIHQLVLVRDDKGVWEILTIKKAISCWRRDVPKFSSEACP